MVTYDERNNAISVIEKQAGFSEKAKTALLDLFQAYEKLCKENNLMSKSAMAMNIAYVTLYLEAIKLRHNIPDYSVDGWIDAFVKDENRKNGGAL